MEASSSGTKAVEDALNEFRLGIFLPKLLDLGVECINDLADLKGDDLKELGFSKIQMNRFYNMASKYDLLADVDTDDSSMASLSTSQQSVSSSSQPSVSSASQPSVSSTSQQSVSSTLQQSVSTTRYLEKSIFNVGCSDYVLFYQTQHSVGSNTILTNLDPFKISLEDLVEIIVRRENFDTTEHSAELYTKDGTPLTNDSYLASYCSLSTRCIESKSTVFAVICKKERQPTVCDDESDTSDAKSDISSDDDQRNASTDDDWTDTSDDEDQPVPSTDARRSRSTDAKPDGSTVASLSASLSTMTTKERHTEKKDVVICCLVTGEHYKIPVDLEEDTPKDVKTKLSEITGIPESVLILKVQRLESFQLDESATLAKNNLQTDDWLNVYLVQRRQLDSLGWQDNFTCEIQPYVEQTDKGMGMFAATLYVVALNILTKEEIGVKLIGAIRRLTGLSPLVTALYLLSKRRILTYAHKVAIVEGLYLLFHRLLPLEQEPENPEVPKANKTKPVAEVKPFNHPTQEVNKEEKASTSVYDNGVSDDCVFELSDICWMYLLKLTQSTDGEYEKYKELRFRCAGSAQTLIEPVTVSSIPGKCFNRSYVLQCIEENKYVDGQLVSDPSTMSQDFEMQKMLLSFLNMSGFQSVGYISNTCFIWDRLSESTKPVRVPVMNVKKFRKEKKDKRFAPVFKLCPPLNLESYNRLTVNENHQYVVYTGITKAVGCPIQLYNPATRETETVDKHKLAEMLKDFDFQQDIEWEPIVREPKEAIIVLLDVSGSMGSCCFDTDMSRLVAVKELFFAFAERSMAYSLQHSIGLTTFSHKVRVMGQCNEYYESFKKLLEYVENKGGTALYDAICNAADQLEWIRRAYPECKRRIICLTDGIDQHSTKTPVEAVRRLESIDCVLDAVQITSSSDPFFGQNTNTLKGIAIATGGCCFQPESLSEGRKVFEMETVLSLRTRKLEPKPKPTESPKVATGIPGFRGSATAEELELQRMAALPWSTEPPCNKPDALTKPVARTLSVLVKASTETKKHKTKDRSKRLLREMAEIQREPHPAFFIYPSESHFDFWKILMIGPIDTPYEGGVFSLYAEFPNNYPDAPPTVRFLTPIYHCNINSIGRICHGIFDRNYTSDTNVKTILSCVFGLLMTPEPRDPLDGVLAEDYFTNKALYNQNAEEFTKMHASTSFKDLEKEMLDSSTLPKRKPPQHLVCPLTKQLLVDPVQTPYGHIYERHAIEAAINKVPCDPEAEEPLSKTELTPAITVRRQATDFRESQAKVAACWLN